MSYKVLARKWRPRNFEQVVGQAHVVRALVNGLNHDRLHHAFLFTGTRGVGKTTLARVLAKALNCEQSLGAEPCGHCSICEDIDNGRFVDLIEVDAASRTGVDDTRDLLENVQYAPSRGKFKVYLIDEVHMFSKSSFNALLKTLEEPPPHVKFLLATTDPQKVPVTVLSRCLQFNLKRLLPDEILDQLKFILDQESVSYQLPALKALAKAADGSMRDGLSLLDQAIVHGNGQVNEADVNDMLGCVAQEPVLDLLRALVAGDAESVLESISAMHDFVPDYSDVLQTLLSHLHHMALAQHIPSAELDPVIHELAGQISREDVQLYYQIGLIGQKDLPLAPDTRSGFEMVLLRMLAFRPVGVEMPTSYPSSQKKPTPESKPSVASLTVPKLQVKPAAKSKTQDAQASKNTSPSAGLKPATKPKESADSVKTGQPQTKPVEKVSEPVPNSHLPWHEMVPQLTLDPMTRQLANNVIMKSLTVEACTLQMTAGFANINPRSESLLAKALSDHLGRKLTVSYEQSESSLNTPAAIEQAAKIKRQQDAEAAIENNETVRAILDTFDGHIVPGSVHPID